jgi:hypothetical protein
MWLLLAAAALLVVAIAWFSVAMVSSRLAATPAMAVFDIEEATSYVADNLPDPVSAKISHDDVRLLLRWEITYLRERGVASYGRVDEEAEFAALSAASMVADEDELVDDLLRRAVDEGIDVDAVDIVCVTDLASDYLVAIGAIGTVVDMAELEPPDSPPAPEDRQ